MTRLRSFRYAVSICAVAGMLAGCASPPIPSNGVQAIGPPGAPPQTSNASSYKVLYAFAHRAYPHAGVIDVKGTLYGTTQVGGAAGQGIVYSLTAAGAEKILHDFKGGYDGAQPEAGLIDVNGTLYGTTYAGGRGCQAAKGCGTVYSISPAGSEKVLYAFTAGSDGEHPMAGLIDVNGTLYGTTYLGGGGRCYVQGNDYGCGTVYSVDATGTEKVVYAFTSESDGAFPEAGLIAVKGSLYGTTYSGGADAQGTAFRVTTAGAKKTLYSFGAGTDASNPQAALIDANGTLYGTTRKGGGATSVLRRVRNRVRHESARRRDGAP